MDFMKWLSSLDELLFEMMSWLVFFPVTLWKTLSRPLAMVRYANEELDQSENVPFAKAVSPPLFLVLAMLLSAGLGEALGEQDALVNSQHGLATLIADSKSALVLRVLLFALFPLLMSVIFIRAAKLPLERMTLRRIFYGQCYPGGAFALILSIGAALSQLPTAGDNVVIIGNLVMLAAVGNYILVEARFFRAELFDGWLRALSAALAGVVSGFAILIAVGLLLI